MVGRERERPRETDRQRKDRESELSCYTEKQKHYCYILGRWVIEQITLHVYIEDERNLMKQDTEAFRMTSQLKKTRQQKEE